MQTLQSHHQINFIRRPFFILTLLALSLTVAACSFDADRTNSRNDTDKRDGGLGTLSSISGVYEGTLTEPDQSTMRLQLSLSYREDVIGTDSDGQPVYRPVISARLIRPDLIVGNSTMQGRFVSETGDLTLSTVKDGGPYFYMRGFVQGSQYNGEIKTAGGRYGFFNLKLRSSEVPSGASDDQSQIERIRARLRPIEGYYIVKVTPDKRMDGKPYEEPYESLIVLRTENASFRGVPINYPILTASYEHKKDPAFLASITEANFKPDSHNELLFASNPNSSFDVSFAGHIVQAGSGSDGKPTPQQILGSIRFRAYGAKVETVRYQPFTN